mmetsp:Transcript_3787/g.9472  ORF Transcript_3787/g.9472 Transcript_3787/m.9472 type:complete len:203 (+) Transcript_3787:224-832(+)
MHCAHAKAHTPKQISGSLSRSSSRSSGSSCTSSRRVCAARPASSGWAMGRVGCTHHGGRPGAVVREDSPGEGTEWRAGGHAGGHGSGQHGGAARARARAQRGVQVRAAAGHPAAAVQRGPGAHAARDGAAAGRVCAGRGGHGGRHAGGLGAVPAAGGGAAGRGGVAHRVRAHRAPHRRRGQLHGGVRLPGHPPARVWRGAGG